MSVWLLAAWLLLQLMPIGVLASDNRHLHPNSNLTPGAWNNPPTPLRTLCAPGHTEKVRKVSAGLKSQVFLSYGYKAGYFNRTDFEIDHLIPLELDGTNAQKNLWPQSYLTTPNARQKDELENRLHKLVCSGRLKLLVAQQAIEGDWIAAYRRYVREVGAPSRTE